MSYKWPHACIQYSSTGYSMHTMLDWLYCIRKSSVVLFEEKSNGKKGLVSKCCARYTIWIDLIEGTQASTERGTMKKIRPFMLFAAISAVGLMTLLSFMSFLPPVNVQPNDHPFVAVGISQREYQIRHEHDVRTPLRESPASNEKPKGSGPNYHMVFSTSCSPFQNWQAMAFFHFAKKVKQQGSVTRLVSGCTDEQAAALTKIHSEKIAPLNPNFQMHTTPDFDVHDNQKYWNKPHGLLDWMEKELGFPQRATEHNDAIIIIVDPDMMLIRPITHDFSNFKASWAGAFTGDKVVHGFPIAQKYAYGAAWLESLKGNVTHVVGPDSPVHNVTIKEAELYYPAGPPYLATGKDMYAIAKHWVKFLPRVHDIFSGFMAEMHAYSVAAAHLKLPHQLTPEFMVSDVGDGGNKREGFRFLDNVTRAKACSPEIPQENLPFVLHYCQRYSLGRWFFGKYKLREDFFECDSPLLREPPLNVAELYDWNVFPNGIEGENFLKKNRTHSTVLHGWMLCKMIYSLNEVAVSLKTKHCGGNANFNKTWHFHNETLFQEMLNDHSNPYVRDGKDDNPG